MIASAELSLQDRCFSHKLRFEGENGPLNGCRYTEKVEEAFEC